MSSIGTGYDQSTTTFSPDGRVFQIEYAAKAVENSGTAVGIRCKDGVVLGVEKQKLSKMLVPGSNRRVYTVDKCTGMAVSGMMADARQVRVPPELVCRSVHACGHHTARPCRVRPSHSDARAARPPAQIVNHARKESANYADFYGTQIPGNVLCDRVAGMMHAYTLYWCACPPAHPPSATNASYPQACSPSCTSVCILLVPRPSPFRHR
jgi:20S proteasome subunit alpha 7